MILDKELGALASRAEGMGLTRVLPREAKETCRNDQYSDTCEKPNISTGEIMLILFIASTVVALGVIALLCYLHRRRQRLDKLEDPKDFQELDDYGIAPIKQKPANMPRAPPPTYERSQDRKEMNTASPAATNENWGRQRDSTDSLTPSLRQAMGVTPRDTLANH
ncbi:hypothetical protein FOXG_08754 [Fusarium oxysporum f. sp. lycopersici 4287]|uniref:Uncharacterized protein n=3 Tax=Fusarium oxysporum TaxID=5507 RepID=A0A0J9V7Z8_FUSO4|nr:hypothetical protein FOXG_08754 [Fusarium oxysporum f. sp. lycopersici 4287]XP_018245694.1 hypothetical protein FOXG_08754 [Fusarium oxysporum f. sp. lycopersici 4287]EXK27907.1 hypothetical protein FOMG_15750 [Fusarium oxysporum f. sp. melonis 26406]KAJ9424233.1 hypothetical protein QL093DRAFT_2283976 [Fusarium oxysporum]EXK27908.1 hypothetical protein FOMG_15750 [Fusarium oxysporum f. sp. melonis 26406]KNB07648.1 hypothetical protein FOXG_08754 [Fusarium oxysporum f. sp. lycopersici 4287]